MLKQIPTMWNPADLGTKGLNRRRHNMLLYLFGFVDEKGERVGELEYQEHKFQEASKSIIKGVKHELPEDSHSFGSSSSSKTAKQVCPSLGYDAGSWGLESEGRAQCAGRILRLWMIAFS